MERLPEIKGDTWFNSEKLTKKDFEGKVVLIDFWTYSCVNCLRTLPFIRGWWEKYKDKGLMIVGVHSPEFEFEKDKNNVKKSLQKLNVTWPVVLDNEMINWNNFANRVWPAKYISDKKGNIVYTHFGEGSYKETEEVIQGLLKGNNMPDLKDKEHSHGNVCFPATPELYCGYYRGRLANDGGYRKDKEADYKMPDHFSQDSIALSGRFFSDAEYVESRSSMVELHLNFQAVEVNLVMDSNKATVEILFNGNPLGKDLWGSDVKSGEVDIKGPRMYNLLQTKNYTQGVLSVRAKKGNFKAFAFTFSGCSE